MCQRRLHPSVDPTMLRDDACPLLPMASGRTDGLLANDYTLVEAREGPAHIP